MNNIFPEQDLEAIDVVRSEISGKLKILEDNLPYLPVSARSKLEAKLVVLKKDILDAETLTREYEEMLKTANHQ
jgi:hypothetical protein